MDKSTIIAKLACRGTTSVASATGSGIATTEWKSKRYGIRSWTIFRRSGLGFCARWRRLRQTPRVRR